MPPPNVNDVPLYASRPWSIARPAAVPQSPDRNIFGRFSPHNARIAHNVRQSLSKVVAHFPPGIMSSILLHRHPLPPMPTTLVIATVVAALLAAYLVVAMLAPERFG